MNIKNSRIQLMHDSAENLEKNKNKIPLAGELVLDIDNHNFKVGDGVNALAALPTFTPSVPDFYDTVIENQTDWDNMLQSTTAQNILIKPQSTIKFAATNTLPYSAQYVRFAATGADKFTLPIESGTCTIQTKNTLQNCTIDNLVQTGVIINNVTFVTNCQVKTISNANKVTNCIFEDEISNVRVAVGCASKSTAGGLYSNVFSCYTCYGSAFADSRNLIGCRGTSFNRCDTIVKNNFIKNATFTNCTNIIEESPVTTGANEGSAQIGYETTKANGEYSFAIGNEKDGVSTETIGRSSVAVGSGVKTYGRYSLAMGSLAATGIPDDIKKQSVANYLNNNKIDKAIKVPAADTYCLIKLRNPAFSEELPAFTPTGENGTYLPEDIDLSLIPENYFIAFGNNSIINGWESDAIGQSTFVLGNKNAAFGHSSVTVGYKNDTWNAGAVAMGVQNEAGYWADQYVGHVDYGKGTAAIALGKNNKAYGTTSAAIGNDNQTTEETSIALGSHLRVSAKDSVAVGTYNENNSDIVFAVGVGESDASRKNALEINKSYTLFKNAAPISEMGFKNNTTQASSRSISVNITGLTIEKRDYVNGVRVYFPIDKMPILNVGDKCTISFTDSDLNSHEILCSVKDVWSIKYCEKEGKGNLPSIAFGPNKVSDKESLQKVINCIAGNIIYSTVCANELDKYGHATANYQTIVGNSGSGDYTTLFAVGNGLYYNSETSSNTEKHNAFEVKYNGDVIIDGNILNANGNSLIPTKVSALENDSNYIVNNSSIIDRNGIKIGNSGTFLLELEAYEMDLVGNTSGWFRIRNLSEPENASDAATKQYVDNLKVTKTSQLENDSNFLSSAGDSAFINYAGYGVSIGGSGGVSLSTSAGTIALDAGDGSIDISGGTVNIHNLTTPTADNDAVNKRYVDDNTLKKIDNNIINYFDKTTWSVDGCFNDGTFVAVAQLKTTNPIYLTKGTYASVGKKASHGTYFSEVVHCSQDGDILLGYSNGTDLNKKTSNGIFDIYTFTIAENGYYRFNLPNQNIDDVMIVAGNEYPTSESSSTAKKIEENVGLSETLKKEILSLNSTNPLYGKKIIYNGDSICEERLNGTAANGGAYPRIIANLTNGAYENRAVGGGTLAVSDATHNIVNDIANMSAEADLVCLEGGINDYWKNIPLGTYSESDFTGELNTSTVCGALESILRQAINKWAGKPIVFVITHKIKYTAFTANAAGYTFAQQHDMMVKILKKYSIPYYDAYESGGLNAYMDALNTGYLNGGSGEHPDGCHPDENGYKKYYVRQLMKLFESVMPVDEVDESITSSIVNALTTPV